MNKQYRELFQVVARNNALNAEKAMEVIGNTEEKKNDIETLILMRDRFNDLEDRLLKGEDPDVMDYIQLYAGAMVSRNILQKNINTWTAIVKEYDDNLIPKLTEVAGESDEEKRKVLIDEFFG